MISTLLLPQNSDRMAVAASNNVDIVIELIGGTTLAKDVILQAINNGKHVVTANKALLAEHGNEIFAAQKPIMFMSLMKRRSLVAFRLLK